LPLFVFNKDKTSCCLSPGGGTSSWWKWS